MFSKRDTNKLPPYRPYDYRIDTGDSVLTYGPLYSMSYEELEVLRNYLRDNLDKGFI